MKDVGDFLKEKRKEKGVSLIEVEENLKIRRKYLTAIEEGNLDIIPGKTYVLGYLRNYCKYLEINNDEINNIIQKYKNIINQQSRVAIKEEEDTVSFRRKRGREFERTRKPIQFRYVYLIGFVFIVFIGLLFVNRFLRDAKNYPIPSPEVNTTSELANEDLQDEAIVTDESEISEEEAMIQEQLLQEKLLAEKLPVLKVAAQNTTWLKILSKDIVLYEGILFKDEEISFKDNDQDLKLVTRYPENLITYYDDNLVEIDKGISENHILEYNFNTLNENI